METRVVKSTLSFQQLAEVVKHLSPDEKLKLNEVIWGDNTPIPTEHQKLVHERIQEAKQNPDLIRDWDEVSVILKS